MALSIILTPNRRLAAFSQQQFQQQQVAAQQRSWPTAEIYPLEAWILQLWQSYLDYNPTTYRPLLTKIQQQQLIEKIIQYSDVAVELLRVNAAAQNVVQAWNFLNQWQVDLDRIANFANFSADTAAFNSWITKYLAWLDHNNYFDFNLMLQHLTLKVSVIKNILPPSICLRGFSEITPQYAKFFAALRHCGVEITSDQLIGPGAHVARSSFLNVEAELAAAASWALAHLQLKPQQIIGIVVPELEQLRQLVGNIFEAIIPKAWLNISAPYPLANYPLIDAALLILQVAKPVINFSDLTLLLRSPFIANFVAEANLRAQIDRLLREKVEAKLSWQAITNLIALTETTFTDLIKNFQTLLPSLQGQHTAEHWTVLIQQLLQCWGWPGDRVLTAIDADMLSCWRDLLDEYCKLSLLLQNHSFAQAIQMIHRLANETPFLPAETGLTKVHILGILEADGIAFDNLWVCGMTRDSWPMEASPNPFIPMDIQRQFDLPRSSAQRELAVAKRLTANFQQGGKYNIIFSYPRLADDHNIAPSNLIVHLPIVEIAEPLGCAIIVPQDLEVLEDYTSIVLENNYVSGGTLSLKLQAQCPFRANAEVRLRARGLPEPQLILTLAERGSLVHEVLEEFWLQYAGYTQLMELLQRDIKPLLLKIINNVLQRWQKKRPFTLTSSYLSLESDRLFTLMYRWLNYEANRSHFTISKLEQKTAVQVGPLQINLKIDRIDQLDDKNFAVIDYKTGNTYPGEWFTDPIYDPQLPLYAVYSQQITAVAIATLQPKALKFMGVAEQDGLLPGVNAMADWLSLKDRWQNNLQQTAQHFANGHAAVAPYSQKICNICQLQAFCRIYD